MDLESCVIDDLGKKIADEMDQHILIGFMLELGWKEINVNPWIHGSLSEINQWVKSNIQGHTMRSGNRWVFEDEKDAIMFALKWG
jgi:hypothetical protein